MPEQTYSTDWALEE